MRVAPLLDHAVWPTLQPFVKIQPYMPDGGPVKPRNRIEVRDPGAALRATFLAVRVPCCACGRIVQPIRERHGHASLFLAVTCELKVSLGCARGRRAAEAYRAIAAQCAPPLELEARLDRV